jgi:hypothetical protein
MEQYRAEVGEISSSETVKEGSKQAELVGSGDSRTKDDDEDEGRIGNESHPQTANNRSSSSFSFFEVLAGEGKEDDQIYCRSLNLNRQTWPPRTIHSS